MTAPEGSRSDYFKELSQVKPFSRPLEEFIQAVEIPDNFLTEAGGDRKTAMINYLANLSESELVNNMRTIKFSPGLSEFIAAVRAARKNIPIGPVQPNGKFSEEPAGTSRFKTYVPSGK